MVCRGSRPRNGRQNRSADDIRVRALVHLSTLGRTAQTDDPIRAQGEDRQKVLHGLLADEMDQSSHGSMNGEGLFKLTAKIGAHSWADESCLDPIREEAQQVKPGELLVHAGRKEQIVGE